MFVISQLHGFNVSDHPAVELTYQTAFSTASDTANTSRTFATQAIGTAAGGRWVLVAIWAISATQITGVTIGGIAAETQSDVGAVRLFYARVPTGTTADIVVTVSGTATSMYGAVWSILNWQGIIHAIFSSSDAAAGTSIAASATIHPFGCAIMTAIKAGSGGYTWTNATERDETLGIESIDFTAADYSNTSGIAAQGRTFTASFTSATNRIIVGYSLR